MDSAKKPFHEAVAEKLIDMLREGTAPWQKPWEPGSPSSNLPLNPTTGKRYRGINALQLMSEGRSDPRWLTYKQASALDAQVRRGEKGTRIQYWKFTEDQPITDADGKPVLNGQGKPVTKAVRLERPRAFLATVFNAEQIDGLTPLAAPEAPAWNAVERAEQILQASGAVVRHGEADRAFYRSATDSIHLPDKSQFPAADSYYATAVHELGHWTGHHTRLNRDLSHPFGSEGYAKEELRAEIASMILGDELGLGHDPKQHAAYVGSWINALRDDPLEIFRAAADAENIRDYVLGLEQTQKQEQASSLAATTEMHPAAFLDTSGILRDWNTADALAGDWQGVVKNEGAFWYLGQEAGERTFTVLAATSYTGAKAEAERVAALAVDISDVLTAPGTPIDDFTAYQGESLDSALRTRSLSTIGSVTGHEPGHYLEKAEDRLAAVFGLEQGRAGDGNASLECKRLAQEFANKAEQIVESRQQGEEMGSANQHAMDRSGVEQTGEFALRVFDGAGDGDRDIPHVSLESAIGAFIMEAGRFGHADFTVPRVVQDGHVVLEIDPDPASMGAMIFANHRVKEAYELAFHRPDATNAESMRAPSVAEARQIEHGLTTHAEAQRRTEVWTLGRLEQGTLDRALDKASPAQMNRILEVLGAMAPLDPENQFWQRHELPHDVAGMDQKIHRANQMVNVRQADARIADARLDMVSAQAFSLERVGGAEAFDREAQQALGFTLPADWSGAVRVQGDVTEEAEGVTVVTAALEQGVAPTSWGVYAQLREGPHALLASRPSEQVALELAERLAVIDARSTVSEHEKAAKLARVNEQRVRRDPNSTDEDISAAKEVRKNAEMAAMIDDADLQRRIEFAERDRAQGAVGASLKVDAPKIQIAVPYKEKEEAKALGAKWDRQQQSWYVPEGVDQAPFAKWMPAATPSATADTDATARTSSGVNVEKAQPMHERAYLAVPYSERAAARAAGAQWDRAAKSWFAGPKADMTALAKWNPENVPAQQSPAMTPKEEFAELLKSVGCVLTGEHPIMDGSTHRITVEGEKSSENAGAGFYVGHLDGHPAGYVKNNKTGVDQTWKSKGYTLDPAQKAQMADEAVATLREREAERDKQQEQAAERVVRQVAKLVPVEQPTPYLRDKGIAPQAGVFTDKAGKKTYIPATDVNGKQWTMQYIQENGTKRFAKESRKEGCFHVVGGNDALLEAPAIVISEGYATAATLKQSLGFATVAAFDSGNLAAVAQALHQKYPDKPIVIAGDDDRHLELSQGVNPGRTKAEEAARVVGGQAILPVFAPGENDFPAGLDAVSPKQYREHQRHGSRLSGEQMAALDRMKQYTDFNDLATKSVLGQQAVDRQVKSAVNVAIAQQHQNEQIEQQQVEVQGHVQGTSEVPRQPKLKRQRKAVKLA
jgi:antirestriction protein ArdC/phage/plasmid primase-like uncharacterized protein